VEYIFGLVYYLTKLSSTVLVYTLVEGK